MAEIDRSKVQQNRNSLCYARRTDSRASTPCMPTPETSQSSDTSIDEQFSRPLARRGAPIHALLSQEAGESTSNPDRRDLSLAAQMTAQTGPESRYVPYSPPYRSDSQLRPSLPPLKTVLAVPLSSPPTTPRLHDAPYPLAAREPSYIASTFKPPAFYPNKKPRMELSPRRSPKFYPRANSIASDRSMALQEAGSYQQFSRSSIAIDAEHFRTALDWREAGLPGARTRIQGPSSVYEARNSDSSRYSRLSSPESRRQSTIGDLRRTSLDVRSPGDAYGRVRSDEYPRYGRPEASLPSGSRAGGVYSSAPDFLEQDRNRYAAEHTQILTARSLLSGKEARGRGVHVEMVDRHAKNEATDQRAAFFMPSHYEYQQGKTRKRSNLPKQSTEIMKHWFDQNIANPYPSEEQKQVFANATGISMTQVSNWFINHRRRCPELCDKRDRSRIGGGELSD